MIFKNRADSANLLAQKIKEEIGADFTLVYINPDSKDYSQLLATNLSVSAYPFSNNLNFSHNLLITDDGSTNAQEYNEFTDKIRKSFPQTKIIIAIPVIPESEKSILESNCDTLIYLHADPYFFSINQFYQEN